jgi:hypothetical protein
MSRSKLRQIKRLRADAAPLIAERDRRRKHFSEKIAPRLAEDHLLRVILVFRYGEPRIDEPLALACGRVLARLESDRSEPLEIPTSRALLTPLYRKLERNDPLYVKYLDSIFKSDPPAEHVKSKIFTWVRQMPYWLRYFCFTDFSMRLLGLDPSTLSIEEVKLYPSMSDRNSWPWLPEGRLEPLPDYQIDLFRFIKKIPMEAAITYLTIDKKPEKEWTRSEHRFVEQMFAGYWSTQVLDKHG